MDGSVPMQEYMRHMNLRTWILTHLKNETIYGLRYMKPEGISGICFEFPWKRIGDQDWKQHWEILLKYAEHRGFPLPTNLDNDKPKLTDIKNKFRNAIDKSQEFEKLGCRNGYRMYRLKSDAQPPAKRKRKFDNYYNAAASSSPDVNYANMIPKNEPASPANMYHQQQQQDFAGILQTAAAPILNPGPEYGELATIADEDLEVLLSGMGDVSNDATFNNIDPTWQLPFADLPRRENSRTSTTSTLYEHQQMGPPQPVAQSQQMFSPQPVGQSQQMFSPQPVGQSQQMGSPQPVGQSQQMFSPQPVGQSQQMFSPQPVAQSQQMFSPQPVAQSQQMALPSPHVAAPLRKIEEIMQTAHISDDEMAVFSISVGQGNQLTTDLINLMDGIQIIFTRDVNNIIREHDSVVGQLLDDVVGDNIKRYSYDGNDVKVKKILKCSYGGIILKYEHRALHIWRLCQARVFVESHFHQQKRKVERCCKDSGIQRLSTFSYQKFITEVQKNPTIDVKDSTRITIGTSDLYLDVYPECTRRLKVALKQPAGGASDEAPSQSINSVDQSIDIVTMQFASASLEQR